MKRNGVDIHSFKEEYLGKKALISRYDIYVDTTDDIRKVINPRNFLPSDYMEEEWKKLMEEALHQEFDPFRNDFENHVRKNFPLKEPSGVTIHAYRAFIERGIISPRQPLDYQLRRVGTRH